VKSSREIIGSLFQGIEDNNIDWEVSINGNIVSAVYDCPITNQRTIYFKIIYNHHKPEDTKLTITIVTTTKKTFITTLLFSIYKEKDGLSVIKDLNHLLDKILSFNDNYLKYHNTDELKVGDRVIVTQEQNFKGKEVGKKGVIVNKIDIGKKDEDYFTVCFDIKFSDDLTYSKVAKNDKCWIFNSNHLQKIKLNNI
jgi:hypothetical protein